MANVKLEIVNRPDVNDASQDVMISDIVNSGEIFEDAGAYYKATITLDADETLAGTTNVTLENGVVIPVSSDTLLGYTSFSDSLDDLYLNGEREFITTIQEVSHSVFSEINATTFSEENVSIMMNDNHTASLVGIFKINSDEDQDNVKFRVVLDTPPKVDTTITVLVEGVERFVTFWAVTDEAILAAGDPVVEILEVQTDLQQPDVYVDPQSLMATITKINGVVLTEGVDSEGGQIKYLNGVNIGDFERLQLFKETATSLIKDTETPVHVDLTATPVASEDTGSITYTATLREEDLSSTELVKHKGVTVTLDEKDADGNDIVITIADGERSGTIDIAVNRDDIYKETEDTISNKIKSVANVLADDAVGAFESLVANTDLVTTAIQDDADAIKVTLTQVKADGSTFAAGESTDIKEGERAFYKVDAVHDENNVNTPEPITGTVDVQFTNGSASFDDYLVNGVRLGADGKLAAVVFGSTIEVHASEDTSYEGESGETFSVALVADSAVPTDAPVGTSGFELVRYEGSATTTIKENVIPVKLKLILVDKDGEGVDVVESKSAYYKAVLINASTQEEIFDATGSVTISLGEDGAKFLEDFTDEIFVNGTLKTDKKVLLGQEFSVKTVDNLFKEENEVYHVTAIIDESSLDPKYKVLEDSKKSSTQDTMIIDDIDPVEVQVIQVSNANRLEGEQASYKAILVNKETGLAVDGATGSVDITFGNGTTQGSSDFTSTTTNIALNVVFTEDIVDDFIKESDEAFTVGASNFTVGGTPASEIYERVLYADSVTTTITDNNSEVTIKLIPLDPVTGEPMVDEHGDPVSIVEESKQAHYVAELYHGNEKISDPTATVDIVMTNGTALTGEDYVGTTKTVTVGEAFTIDTVDNVYKEVNETFKVSIKADTLVSTTSYENVEGSDVLTTITDDVDPVTATLTAETTNMTTTLNVALSHTMAHDVKNPLTFTIADNGTAMTNEDGTDVTITIGAGATQSSVVVQNMSVGSHDITFLALPEQDAVDDFEGITPVIDKSAKLDIIAPCPLDPEDDCTFIEQGDTKKIDVLGNDIGKDFKILSVDGVEHGSVEISADGRCLTYTSDDSMQSGERLNTDTGVIESYRENPFFGTDSFTYTVQDQYGQTGTATVDAHIISTGNKRDVFNGDARDEYVVAGGGNDYLAGGAGNDWYFFSKGDDKDVIVDTAGTDDRIVFTSSVGNDTTQLKFKLESDGDLLVCYGDSGDMITVKQQQQTGAIDRIEMDNGCYLSNNDVDKIVQTLSAYNAEGADGAHMISEIQNDAKFGQIVWHNHN